MNPGGDWPLKSRLCWWFRWIIPPLLWWSPSEHDPMADRVWLCCKERGREREKERMKPKNVGRRIVIVREKVAGSDGERLGQGSNCGSPQCKKSTRVCYFLYGTVLILRGYLLKQPIRLILNSSRYHLFPDTAATEFHTLMGLCVRPNLFLDSKRRLFILVAKSGKYWEKKLTKRNFIILLLFLFLKYIFKTPFYYYF